MTVLIPRREDTYKIARTHKDTIAVLVSTEIFNGLEKNVILSVCL